MTTLTMKEEKRLEIIQRVFRGELTVVEAGVGIGVRERECYRIKARETKRGATGVGESRGFNDPHLTEKLAEQEKLEISRETVRQILRSYGIASPRKRRANKHRSRRGRRGAGGERT